MAMMELENAQIAGRIGDARIEIAARLEKLRDIPGLHAVDTQAIEDALSGLHGRKCTEELDRDNECQIAKKAGAK